MEREPTVGRIVHYFPPARDAVGQLVAGAVRGARIIAVHTVTRVTLDVTPIEPGDNSAGYRPSVHYSDMPAPNTWRWPPRV